MANATPTRLGQNLATGDANMSIKRDDPKRRKAFFDRMNPILAKVKGNKKLSPVYWSLRSWKLGTKIT